MIEKPPPNFAAWTLKETLSLFIEFETPLGNTLS